MENPMVRGPHYHSAAKEFARFCRINRVFMVDGLEVWRAALRARELPEDEIDQKIAAAAEFVRRMGEVS
ncbi:MAG TPA: hypothetical protein VFH83_12300 [Spirochaetia bacterium]|nr:hypothetical protein [Spirochaetia bacterium]